MKEWIEQQAASLRALCGCTVLCWHGIEMALRDAGADGLPDWQDPSAPFLQLNRLDLTLAGRVTASIITYQNDDRWGLYRHDSLPPSRLCTDEPDSIFRSRWLHELPQGQIRDVSVSLNEGDIAEVRLDVEGCEVRLWAGEVYEQNDGSLRVVTMDESVLVQVDGRRPEATSRVEPGAAPDTGRLGGGMSEEMWLASHDPLTMLTCLRELGARRRLSERSLKRKLRLFVVAQCRRLHQNSKMQARCDHLVQLAVRQADGLASVTDLRIASAQTDYELDLSNTGFFQSPIDWITEPGVDAAWLEGWAALELAYYCSLPDAWEAAEGAIRVMLELPVRCAAKALYLAEGLAGLGEVDLSEFEDRLTESVRPDHEPPARAALCAWLREMFGNPFRPVSAAPALLKWNDGALSKIAQTIYDTGCFDQLPVLADALEEAGCIDPHILTHCRERAEHARGCWVVDQLAGRR